MEGKKSPKKQAKMHDLFERKTRRKLNGTGSRLKVRLRDGTKLQRRRKK